MPGFMRVRRSVRGKLLAVVLLTTAIALVVAGIAMLTHDLDVYRQSWASDLGTEASILALSTAPALAFDDHTAAQRNLAALQARASVQVAALYTTKGELYADYVRAGEAPPPSHLPVSTDATRISGERVELIQSVVRDGEHLGTIFLRARYDVVSRVKAYLGIFALVTLMSMVVALVLSTALQKVITAPLDAMANVARQIVTHRDYSLRAQKTTRDEIGLLVDAFNSMLDEVQSRARAQEQSNAAVRESEKLYRAIGESIDYGVWVCDAQGHNIYASESFLRLTGMTQAQGSELGWGDALHPEELQATLAAWQECVHAGSFWYREHRVRGVDGHYHPVLAQGVPIKDEYGRNSGWAGINLDISRLKRTEEALREADRRKDEFLATLAHELRNPLAPIRHAVKLLEAHNADERQRQWGREVIARQVQRMALLLDDLLDVSRITRGRLELKKDYVDLRALVGAAVETARPLIDAKQHALQVELPEEPIELEVDPLRLSQALSNLLTNAAKYTDAGGRISLQVMLEAYELVISISDTGIGLDAATLPKLFEMFSQIDSVMDRAEGGLGIGLALVKGLIALHGGTVEAASAGLGRGSVFKIRLPRAVVVSQRTASLVPASGANFVPGPRGKILIADDNRDAADTLALVLKMSGYEVYVAHRAQEALDIGMRERPGAVILDIGMPDMTGYEVAHRIRQEAWGGHALLLAVTGWGQENDKQNAKAAGFDHHFTKPVDSDQVERLLSTFFRHAQADAPRNAALGSIARP